MEAGGAFERAKQARRAIPARYQKTSENVPSVPVCPSVPDFPDFPRAAPRLVGAQFDRSRISSESIIPLPSTTSNSIGFDIVPSSTSPNCESEMKTTGKRRVPVWSASLSGWKSLTDITRLGISWHWLAIALAAALVARLVGPDLVSPPLLINQISVPTLISEQGYTSNVMGAETKDEIERIERLVKSTAPKDEVRSAADESLDIEVPDTKLSLRSITRVGTDSPKSRISQGQR